MSGNATNQELRYGIRTGIVWVTRAQDSIFDYALNRFLELSLADDSANNLHFSSLTVYKDS